MKLKLILGMAVSAVLVIGSVGLFPVFANNDDRLTAEDLVWETITFGQSVDFFLNFTGISDAELASGEHLQRFGTRLDENGVVEWFDSNFVRDMQGNGIQSGVLVPDFDIESRGGKITAAHDGIVFYFTRIPTNYNFELSADVKLVQMGPLSGANPNGQEGIGLMVRDVIGDPRREVRELGFEELTAASNFASARIQRQNVTYATNLFWTVFDRDGVVDSPGNPGNVTNRQNSFRVHPGEVFNVKLERTNNGFVTTFTDPNGNTETLESVYGADIVQRIDGDYMYVGFYAARNARAEFSNASINISPANTVSTPEHVPARPAPEVTNLSPDVSIDRNYLYSAKFNYDGVVTLVIDGVEVISGRDVRAFEPFTHIHELRNHTTEFELTFTPADGAPNRTPIETTTVVTRSNELQNPLEIFVSPDPAPMGNGTVGRPTDIDTAIRHLAPGGTIHLLGGDYEDVRITTTFDISGQKGAMKTIKPADGHEVRFVGHESGFQLDGDFWHIQGMEVAGGNIRIRGNNNIVEDMIVHSHITTGVQIGNGIGTDPRGWPSNNLVLNSVSFNNADPARIDADGFAAKLGVGEGNIFRGCITFNNVDDGWDLYNRVNEGANMPVLMEYSVAFNNGMNLNGEISGQGSGFKVGGEGIPVNHTMRNNLAFGNMMDGLTCNFNPGVMLVDNNIAFDNVRHNFIFRSNTHVAPANQGIFTNNLSFRTDGIGMAAPDSISGNFDASNQFFDLNGTGTPGAPLDTFESIIPEALASIAALEITEGNNVDAHISYIIPILRDIIAAGGGQNIFNSYFGTSQPAVLGLIGQASTDNTDE